jgi:hypothetical protein
LPNLRHRGLKKNAHRLNVACALANPFTCVSNTTPTTKDAPTRRRQPLGRLAAEKLTIRCPDWVTDRDRGTPRGATPPTPPGIRVTYPAVRLG